MSITQLTAGTQITRQAVTKHLHVLADAGLVRDVKIGRQRLWQFEPGQLDEAAARSSSSGSSGIALARLKMALER